MTYRNPILHAHRLTTVRAWLLPGLLAGVVAFAACGGASTSPATPTPPRPAGTVPAAAPASSPAASGATAASPAAGAATVASPAAAASPVTAASPAAGAATAASPAAAASPASAVQKVNANTASQDQIAAALQAAGVPNAARWAVEVVEYRPYPTDDPNFAKLRQNLAKYNPGPGVVDQIVATLTP